jgi:hypothetical protein
MKILFILTAIIEAGTGLALLVSPSEVVTLLVGSALYTPTGLTIERWTGVAVLALGMSCWLARNDERSGAATGLVAAMLLYNAAIVALLASARIGSELGGVGFWPAIVLHTAMAVWCVACLSGKRVELGEGK